MKGNLEGPESEAKGILYICPTRWIVHTSWFQPILDNYAALLQEKTISLDEKLQSGIRGRIIGCQVQMNTFNFLALNLGQRLFSLTSYQERYSSSKRSGKGLACLLNDVLQKMQDDTSFRSFYDVVLLKSKSYPSMTGPMLPRGTRAPRIEIGTGEPTYPVIRRIYFEPIDLMTNAIDKRFDQPSFDSMQRWSLS